MSSIQAQTTNCVYVIDDGTGRIEARHWVDSNSEEDTEKWGGIESVFFPRLSLQSIDGVREKTYVRVTGGLKTFGSKRYINTTHVRPSKDPHELYFHILEAITVTLTLERGPVSRSSAALMYRRNIDLAAWSWTNTTTERRRVNDGKLYKPIRPYRRRILSSSKIGTGYLSIYRCTTR